MTDVFTAPHFHDDNEARKTLEALLWPDGPVCPHCGVVGHAYATKRAGVYRCAEKDCRKDFTVTMKTVMERSHIALHKWLQAFHLMCSSKKGISAHQLHRTLDVAYEAAWFMAHRIREAMRAGGLAPLGGRARSLRRTKPITATSISRYCELTNGAASASTARAISALSSLWSNVAAMSGRSMSPLRARSMSPRS